MLFPLVIVVVLGIVQAALWSHANSVALAAAEAGAEAAAAFDASGGDGKAAADAFLAVAGQIDSPVVSSLRTADQAVVTVTGTYPSVLGSLEVQATATVPIERVVP